MKYHSMKWWRYAIKEHIKDFIRNTLCRKLLNIDFGYTKPDLLSIFIIDNKEMLYKVLINKYPELKKLRKYLKTEQVITVAEFVSAGIFYQTNKTVSVFWTNESTLEDIYFLIENKIPVTATIRNTLDVRHTVCIVGFDENHIIFNDPLGDPYFKYKIACGYNITYENSEFLKAAGEKIMIAFMINNKNIELIKKLKRRFTNRQLYSLEADDFNKGVLLNKNNFSFCYYSENGKLDLSIDIGKEAKQKFIIGYGEFSNTNNELWKPDEKDIMETIYQYEVYKIIKILRLSY